MESNNISDIYAISSRRIAHAPLQLHRSLYSRINWDNRLIALKGARGTGKTTLLLQRLKEAFPNSTHALYASLDNLWFTTGSLRSLVEYHVLHGGTHLFLDEVHYLQNWQTVIKNLYDDFPELSIVYTGSSMLQISRVQGDLSRRQMIYELPGLSLREYLLFEGLPAGPALSLPDLLESHQDFAQAITGKVKIYEYFDRYLTQGYYPFYLEPGDGYSLRILQVINQVLEGDYPAIEDVLPNTIRKARRMLMLLSSRPPQTPNISELSRELELDRSQCLRMLYALERAGLLNLLETENASLKNLARPQKIYSENPNLMHALVPQTDIGTLRECFILNQLKAISQNVLYPQAGDFLVDGKYLFEVGGHGKKYTQIKDIPSSYLAVDDVEIGYGNRIPLWCFGFLY